MLEEEYHFQSSSEFKLKDFKVGAVIKIKNFQSSSEFKFFTHL